MKKILLISVFVIIAQSVFACEFCGCSSGNYFIGPFPQFRKNFVGIRYSFRRFNTVARENPAEFSHDFYQTTEIWGGVNFGSRWQVLGFLPYNINLQHTDDGSTKTAGVGDITVIVNYNLLKISKPGESGHQLWLGGGLKLPTGKFSVDPDDLVSSANSQPGSGSFDVLVNGMYSFQGNGWGISSNVNYKINRNAANFRFGNRFAANAFAYRTFSTLIANFNPNAGFLFEHLAASKQDGINVEATGGQALLAAAGLETNLKRMTVGFNLQLPLSQSFSDGQTSTRLRGMLHVTYVF